MLRYALPSLGNNWLVLMKNTALVSIIGLQDIVRIANAAARSAQKKDLFAGFWFYGAMAAWFLILTTFSIAIPLVAAPPLLRRTDQIEGT